MVIALICHEGMVVVVLWSILTSVRMDTLRELKAMELQLAELRVSQNCLLKAGSLTERHPADS